MNDVDITPDRLLAHSDHVEDVASGFDTLKAAAQTTESYGLTGAYGIKCAPILVPVIKTAQDKAIEAIQAFRDGIGKLATAPSSIAEQIIERDSHSADTIHSVTGDSPVNPEPVEMPEAEVPGTTDPIPTIPRPGNDPMPTVNPPTEPVHVPTV